MRGSTTASSLVRLKRTSGLEPHVHVFLRVVKESGHTRMHMNETKQPILGFEGLGLAPRLLSAIQMLGFTEPTPIQSKAIPVAVEGGDLIGVAETGTGKTFAFGLPLLQRVAREKTTGLVVLPTRELALQVEEALHEVGKQFGLRTAVLIGGASMSRQISMIRRKPHVIIATPGRLIDHMEQRNVSLGGVGVLVLDEADRMLDMGFMPQIRRILKGVPEERQTMLFSATMPGEIVRIANRFMRNPVRVEVATTGTTAKGVEQRLYVLQNQQKIRLLDHLLSQHEGSVLVFSRTRHGAKRISRTVKAMGHTSSDIHSDRTLSQRREALEGFKKGRHRVLVATDIAARGIDVEGITLVINYDVPENAEDYVHRIGRTARAGRTGIAISFATPDQGALIGQIERLTRCMLPISPLPDDLPPSRVLPRGDSSRRGGYSRPQQRRNSVGRGRGGYGGGGNRRRW